MLWANPAKGLNKAREYLQHNTKQQNKQRKMKLKAKAKERKTRM